MRIVVALGGNALLQRGEKADAEMQLRNVAAAVPALADLAADHELIITCPRSVASLTTVCSSSRPEAEAYRWSGDRTARSMGWRPSWTKT